MPQPSPQPSPALGTGDEDDPGLFDIPGQIRKAINDFLIWLAKKVLDPVLEVLGSTVLSTPDLTGNPAVKAVWTMSMVTANAFYGLLMLAGCFIVMSRETVQTQYGLKEIAPRVAAGAVLSNLSLIICGKVIEVANALTAGVMGEGVDPQDSADAIGEYLMSALTGPSANIMFGLLGIAVAALGIVAVITFVMRVGLFFALIGIGPIVLVMHATPQTEGIAYTWWRAVGACAGLQVGQAVIMLATVKVFLTPKGMQVLGIPANAKGLIGVLVCITMLWLLIKLPGLMKQFVLAPIGLQSQGRGLIGQLLQAYVTFKTLGAAAGVLSAGRNALPTRPPSPNRATGAGMATRAVPARRVLPAPGRSRPSPAVPVQFSHAPATQTPLAAPAGVNGPPAFSNPPQPAAPVPASTGTPALPFSHPPTTGPATARPSTPAANPAFSNSTPAPPIPSTTGPPPAAAFSSPPARQSAPRRPPAPVAPVFSNPPVVPPSPSAPAPDRTATRTRTAGRPTAARRAADPPAPASPRHATGGRRQTPPPASSAELPPRPGPRGTTAPVFRPASTPPPSPDADTGAEPSPPASPLPVRRCPGRGAQ
ncbi:hypothetical protein FB565_002948 [Actinoplanes lutulentus]|uniref:TrbL/VirB6 plasmid conjugal transfer protein n=1 Tax=Actinoplanes lutulentus TaxID=1287878 RepID=A0A327Z1L1_9ACTN|nr:hypothetical protein [Actinoplanes lutulentus]MBB2943235.1 hypothetical protein [Actinoplanes lutulentus]RAK28296.1 hypothetical protein B0I29_12064 [Actinoplanes lutulentus]